MSTQFSFRVTELNLKAVLESMEQARNARPELAHAALALEVQAELIPDGISYEVVSVQTAIVVEDQDTPVVSFETTSLEEITEKSLLN